MDGESLSRRLDAERQKGMEEEEEEEWSRNGLRYHGFLVACKLNKPEKNLVKNQLRLLPIENKNNN